LNGNNILLMQKKIVLFLVFLILVVSAGMAQVQDRLKQMRSDVVVKKNGKEYYLHTVKRGQTLYMISKAYGVDVTDIIQENPEVKEGIKSEQKIRIPKNSVAHEPSKKQPKAVLEEPAIVTPAPPPAEENLPCEVIPKSKRGSYNIALMMPLYLNEVAQMDVDELAGSDNQDCHPLQFIEFYEGFRIALDSLKKSGISLQVNVYDITKDTVKIKRLLKEPELKKMDLIIGFLYNKPFHLVEEFSQKNKIPLINPLSERDQIIEDSPRVIKVRPTPKTQVSQLAQYLSENYSDANIIIIHNKTYSIKDAADEMLRECNSKKLDARISQGYESTLGLFSKDKENLMIVFSEDKSYVLDLITKLNEWRNEYKVTLIGLPRWDKLEDIEVDYLVNLKTHIIAPYFIDYGEPQVKKFVATYQDQYKTDPGALAFQGFDVAYYFITALERYGKTFERCLPDLHMTTLENDFEFSATKGNGFVNQHWEIYRYEDYLLKGAGHK